MKGITMAGRRFEGMREAELSALERTRVQAWKVTRLKEKCNVIVPRGRYRSPAFSGTPGGGAPSGLDGSRRECEALLEELKREEGTLQRMRAQAEKIIERSDMKAEMREFCRGYYIERMSVERASGFAGISQRTGWNYRAEILAKKRRKSKAAQRKNSI